MLSFTFWLISIPVGVQRWHYHVRYELTPKRATCSETYYMVKFC